MTQQNEDEIRAQIRAAVEQARLAVAQREMYGGGDRVVDKRTVSKRGKDTPANKRTNMQYFAIKQENLPTRRRDSSEGPGSRMRAISSDKLYNRHRSYKMYYVTQTDSKEKGKLVVGNAVDKNGKPVGRKVTGSPAQAAKKAVRIISSPGTRVYDGNDIKDGPQGSDERDPIVFDLVEVTQGLKLKTERAPYGKNRAYRFIGWVKESDPHPLVINGQQVLNKEGNPVVLNKTSKAYKVKRDNWHLPAEDLNKLAHKKADAAKRRFKGISVKPYDELKHVYKNDKKFVGAQPVKKHLHHYTNKGQKYVKDVEYSRAYGKEESRRARERSRS